MRQLFTFSRVLLFLVFVQCQNARASDWKTECAKMPLRTNELALNLLEGAPCLLASLQPNATVKALLILPGATDELHFFNRGVFRWTNTTPTLTDAIEILTNHTGVKTTFRAPFLLLHTTNDLITTSISTKHLATGDKLSALGNINHPSITDASWLRLGPLLEKSLNLEIEPKPGSIAWWHFYRANFSCFDITGPELIEIVSLSSRIAAQIDKNRIVFSIR